MVKKYFAFGCGLLGGGGTLIKNHPAESDFWPGDHCIFRMGLNECFLQPSPSNEVRDFIKKYAITHELSFYDILNNRGLLRSLMIRTSNLGETMIALVFGTHEKKNIQNLLNAIKTEFPKINSIWYFINFFIVPFYIFN